VIDKLRRHIRIARITGRHFDGDLRHVLAKQRHPGSAIRLLQVAAAGQGRTPVEDADIVEPQESSLKHVFPEAVFAVHPPGEVQHQLLKRSFEKVQVAFAP